ncbi:MAG: serine/threonine-protein kinase [Acidobacteriaceae bacterium]|nr:serine/threonine-protein kinase [Acidobacteriaceae bacterium]
MGVVYRARDTHLGRMVAIKCLSAQLFSDSASKQRFFQEARAASSLNHPNIITIYELFNEGGSDYLVMEYVKGKTLEQILSSKRLRVRELLEAAVQISDALATAHASGIIHRDIKPSNVMVPEDRRIKVLDFGLAKVLDQRPDTDESSRTKLEQTTEGMIIGSASYMSPEQAEGRPVDARTDIFSLGALMYEMSTGQRAFAGESRVSTLAAVLTREPVPIEEIAPDTPRELQRVILRCLQKDPRRRFQSMLDLKLTLEELKADSDSGQLARLPPHETAKRRSSWIPAAVIAGLVLAIVAWFWLRAEHTRIRQPLALEQLTFDSGLTTNPTIAPDGKLIAYASDRAGEGSLDIWVQYRGGEPVRITRDPTDEDEPSFSPDGTKIAYASRNPGGGIYIVSSLGGQSPQQIVSFGNRPQFSPDGSQLLFVSSGLPSLSRVYRISLNEAGAAPIQVAPELFYSFAPLWSPDGKHILFLGAKLKGNDAEDGPWIVCRRRTPPRAHARQSLDTGESRFREPGGLATRRSHRRRSGHPRPSAFVRSSLE